MVIFSCVRANAGGSLGHTSDTCRMNVALTRAKYGHESLPREIALVQCPVCICWLSHPVCCEIAWLDHTAYNLSGHMAYLSTADTRNLAAC